MRLHFRMLKWLPWKYIVRRAARAYGITDPIMALARLRRFAQPSEVQEPLELLRAGIVFHARGLVNTQAIQHNLDWVWPFWINRQFDPDSRSFIPRGFSFSHINLTHRNWTAVGLPELDIYPIVDPRGLVTPLHDGWSLDFWIRDKDGTVLLPGRLDSVEQRYEFEPNLVVETICRQDGMVLRTRSEVVRGARQPHLLVTVEGEGAPGGALIVALRPYNPEGIQFIEEVQRIDTEGPGWMVNKHAAVRFSETPAKSVSSTYAKGDVFHHLDDTLEPVSVHCGVGMATAAAFFPCADRNPDRIEVRVPLGEDLKEIGHTGGQAERIDWPECRAGAARLEVPDAQVSYLYEAAVHSLILHSAGEIYPGPYTYRRFWFRDACIILQALLALGLEERCRRAIVTFPERQTPTGYFQSQAGEWDSNGQVLWIVARFAAHTGSTFSKDLVRSLVRGVRWIARKRRSQRKESRHSGLLPAGFSAEHLGPNDFYFWDDYWAFAGMRDISHLFAGSGMEKEAEEARREAADLFRAIEAAIEGSGPYRRRHAIPASPYRRMDAGAVGSLVADYPLQIYAPGDRRILNTVAFLRRNCFRQAGFFQDMVHSGINAYLTLAIAQSLLRAGNPEWADLMRVTAGFASPTGQWPEAIHPATHGGCMGDGHHVWASAEWVMMIRNAFVREESDCLHLGNGVLPEWLEKREPIRFGPTYTAWGSASFTIEWEKDCPFASIEGDWHTDPPPQIQVSIPGYRPAVLPGVSTRIPLERAP